MHIDLDYFYAQCEENLNESIRGKPVVVCVYSGRTEESGVVSTCNYEARDYGVRAGIPITRAKKLLDTTPAVFLPMNRPHYEEVSNRILEVVKAHGDSFEKVGIDEAFIEVTVTTDGNFREAEKIAGEIRLQILQQERITCSIGIAPNKMLAKIASDHQKPKGLTIVEPGQVVSFLKGLPVNRIPGVGRKVEEKLNQLKVKTVDQLSGPSPSSLVEVFGISLGTYLYRAARGEDDEPVRERDQPSQFSRIATLRHNTYLLTDVQPLLEELATSVTMKLIKESMTCKSIGVIAILEDLSIHSKSKTLDSPTNDEQVISQVSKDLMKQFLDSEQKVAVRRVGVKLSGLARRSGQTDISKFLHA